MRRRSKVFAITFLVCYFFFCQANVFAWQNPQSTPTNETTQNADTAASQASTVDEDWNNAPDTNVANTTSITPFSKWNTPPVRNEKSIDNASWQKMVSNKDFQYEDEAPKPEKEDFNWWSNMFMTIFGFLTSSVGKIIEIVLVAALVLFLIFRIIKLNGNILFSKKDKKLHNHLEEDTEIETDDWEKEIKNAAQNGNYRLALRYGYRYLLQMLQDKELIKYQVAKTNYQYVYELTGTPYHKPFMQLTREYEYAWYGGFDIEKPFFENYFQMIQNIKQELRY